MGLRLVAKPELTEWENTYIRELQDSEVTEESRSFILNLQEVKNLVAYIEEKNQENPPANIDGVEIYLTRWSECEDKTQVNHITSKGNISQISIAIVPLARTENFFENKGSEEVIMCLFPGDKSATGHCPPCDKKAMADKKDAP